MSFDPLFLQPTNSLAILLGGKSLEGIWARRGNGGEGERRKAPKVNSQELARDV
jgi:hypothetical protein